MRFSPVNDDTPVAGQQSDEIVTTDAGLRQLIALSIILLAFNIGVQAGQLNFV